MKIVVLLFLLFIIGCSSETPREKAKRYIGYIDSFYIGMTDDQEKMLEGIVDHYFNSKQGDLKLNKKIYNHLEQGLSENKELDLKYVQKLIDQKLEFNKKVIPGHLKLINDFYNTLSMDQKKKMLKALQKLKKKSARMRFWLGEEEKK